jgi:hypothetical protein
MDTDTHRDLAQYVNKPLLLARRDLSGLFVHPHDASRLLLNIDWNGSYTVTAFVRNRNRQVAVTLRAIGENYLGLRNPSLRDLLRYLVTPEMEVERIFNVLRYKYLQAISLSRFDNPQQYLSYRYNKAFQTLAGLTIYQGSPVQRKPNHAFWQEAGFSEAATHLGWKHEHHALQTIIALIKQVVSVNELNELYAELIAIKPGFHELYLHRNYFDPETIPKSRSARDAVFRLLRNAGDLSSLNLQGLPAEMNKNNFISYAPCTITEGPFVFRKHPGVNYVSEIRSITSKEQLPDLSKAFHILDYYHRDLSTQEELTTFLIEAQRMCRFIT